MNILHLQYFHFHDCIRNVLKPIPSNRKIITSPRKSIPERKGVQIEVERIIYHSFDFEKRPQGHKKRSFENGKADRRPFYSMKSGEFFAVRDPASVFLRHNLCGEW